MPASPDALRPADLGVALGLLSAGILLRLPLIGLGETVDESLDPLVGAMALRDHLELRHPGFFHFGYGRDLSHLPFVLGVDGLVDAQTRRSLVQALLGPLVFLAGRRLGGGVTGPALAALILVTGEELLHTGVSGHETYLSGEWVAVALLAVAGRSWRSAVVLGAALAMALMSHPFALPALVLPALHPRRREAAAALIVVLLPQILRVAAALAGELTFDQVVLARPLQPVEEVPLDLADFLRGTQNPDVLLLLLGPLALAVRRSVAPRLAAATLLGLALVGIEVVFVGWSEGWYWRPIAPWLALALGLAASPRRWWAQAPLALAAIWLAWTSVERTAESYRRTEEGIKYADHVHAVAGLLEARRADAPLALFAVAEEDGRGRRNEAWPIVVDRMLAGRAEGLLATTPAEFRRAPTLLHVAGAPETVRAAGISLLPGREAAAVWLDRGDDLSRALAPICARVAGLSTSNTRRWQSALGGSGDLVWTCADGLHELPAP